MQLFIVGNGFDRGHGLTTSYWDFRTCLENMYPEFLYSFEAHYDIFLLCPQLTFKNADLVFEQLGLLLQFLHIFVLFHP